MPWEPERLYLHGGKRRIEVDYRTEAGRTYLTRLAATCELVVTDASVADVREHRLLELGMSENGGPAARISITPFGLSGPYADLPATEATLLAMAGHTFLIGDPDREPLTLPGHYGSYQAGSLAYVAGLASALAPQTTGSRAVEISVLEVLLGLHQYTDVRYYHGDRIRSRHGNRVEHAAGTMLPVKDGWIGFSLLQNFWEPFAMMIGRADLVDGDTLSTNEGRLANRDEFETMVSAALSNRGRFDLFRDAQEVWRVPLGYTATLADCLEDPPPPRARVLASAGRSHRCERIAPRRPWLAVPLRRPRPPRGARALGRRACGRVADHAGRRSPLAKPRARRSRPPPAGGHPHP